MAIEPIYEKISISGTNTVFGEPFKCECKSALAMNSASEILSVTSLAGVFSSETLDGQVRYNGKTTFYVCYLSTDGEIKKTECSKDFSGVVKCESAREGFKSVVNVKTLKTEYEVSGANLNVACMLKPEIEICIATEKSALSVGENIVTDPCEISTTKSLGIKEGMYPIEEEFELSCEIKEVLHQRASAVITDVQCGVGTIIVDGQIFLSLILLQNSEKCSIIRENRTLPYRMEIECEEAMPTLSAIAHVYEKALKVDVLVDSEKGKSKITATINLYFTGEAFVTEAHQLANDVFSIKEKINVARAQVEYLKPGTFINSSSTITCRAGTSELPIGVNLLTTCAESIEILAKTQTQKGLQITGVLTLCAYFIDTDGKPFSRKLEAPFEKEIELFLDDEVGDVQIYTCVPRSSARLVSATEIELEWESVFMVYAKQLERFSCITDLQSAGEKAECPHAVSVYIPFENEELWSLSKRLNVCPETLVTANPELNFPLTGNERIVVYRQK